VSKLEVVPYILHVVPYDVEWRVLENGTEPSQNVYATREEAEQHAINMADAAGYGEIVLYDEGGFEESRYMYTVAA
jgi:hypothetical protein